VAIARPALSRIGESGRSNVHEATGKGATGASWRSSRGAERVTEQARRREQRQRARTTEALVSAACPDVASTLDCVTAITRHGFVASLTLARTTSGWRRHRPVRRQHGGSMRRALPAVVVTFLCTVAGRGNAESRPYAETESRARCNSYSKNRQPFFGELHSHTAYSADASTLDTRNTPRDSYRFAQGQTIGLPPFVDTRKQITSTPSSQSVVTSHPYCLPPARCEFTATRVTSIGRPIDFAAITDHAEWLGETNICFFEGTQACASDSDCLGGQICSNLDQKCVPIGHDSETCMLARQDVSRLRPGTGALPFGLMVESENPFRLPFCSLPSGVPGGGDTCSYQANNVWQQIIADAEEAYDRSSQCSFTSFVAYEYTSMPGMGQCASTNQPCFADADCGGGNTCLPNAGGGNNLHRNIIFRNANVIARPISYIEEPTGCGNGNTGCNHGGALASPVQMLQALAAQCNSGNNCDFVSIPHNSNVSGGAMFLLPETVEEAEVRSKYEPLAEIMQIKGQSECRYSRSHPGAWGTLDEQCNFENMSFAKLTGPYQEDPNAISILPQSYLRNTLLSGLAYRRENGVDPFHLGFVGATDNHAGMPSDTEEPRYAKDGAHGDNSFVVSGVALNETNFLGMETNGGGLTVAWAEENSRDSIFSAFKRRETYATSGTRPIVRFFGGFGMPKRMCKRGDFAEQGYANGVPMGGTLGAPTQRHRAPTFAVLAMKDPGSDAEHPGTPLQRVQIVKGWVDSAGKTHESVFDVAGNKHDRAWVDLRTCEPHGRGFADLCAEWTDEDFDPNEHAFYYARVLENPSCRWNQYYCLSRSVDCSKPSRANDDIAPYTQFEYQQCCSNAVPKTIQERAWTSPIWYSPAP
jgi:hypothetical protein